MKRRKFIKITGSCAALMSSSGIVFAFNESSTIDYENDLKKWSIAAFNRYEEIWNFNDFWKRGNTFDACLTFVNALCEKWPKDPVILEIQWKVKDMLVENLSFFNKFDPGDLWADDFGWWGLMALNARKHLLRLDETELADKYLKLSTELCWEYKKRTAYDHSYSASPVLHGCRNGDANGTSKGVKNTVTNVLLFLLSSRIYRLTLEEDIDENDKYIEMAFKQWLWFEEWFDRDTFEYFKKTSTNGVLVQERPMAFVDGSSYMEKIHPPWAEGWVWTGDQGMVIAALSDMLTIKKELNIWTKKNKFEFDEVAFEIKIGHIINMMAQGISDALISDIDGVIREAPCLSSFGPVHGNDYLAGRGIMMRYLGGKNERALIGVDLSENIKNTVKAIWAGRNLSNNQFQPEFTIPENDHLYITQFKKVWGLADEVIKWDLEKMKMKNKQGVCQSIGLDALGAAIKYL